MTGALGLERVGCPAALVSIIIPTRNRAPVLARCLEALGRQSFPAERFEVIVVDDGSADATPATLERAAAGLRVPLRAFRQAASRGANAARNRGVKEARGKLVVFMDDDTIAPEGWLEALVADFQAAAHPVGTGPVLLCTEGRLPGRHRSEIASYLTEVIGPETGPGGIVVPVSANMIARRGDLLRTEFDETVQPPSEETDWLLRSGLSVAFLPSAWVWHYKGAEELGRLRLLRLAWRRGGEGGRWTRERLRLPIGRRAETAGQALTTAARAVAHGFLRACWGGVAVGAGETSRALALLGLTRRSGLGRGQP